MALRRDIYRLFENVVVRRNISDEPAVLQSYMYQPFGSKEAYGRRSLPRPSSCRRARKRSWP